MLCGVLNSEKIALRIGLGGNGMRYTKKVVARNVIEMCCGYVK